MVVTFPGLGFKKYYKRKEQQGPKRNAAVPIPTPRKQKDQVGDVH